MKTRDIAIAVCGGITGMLIGASAMSSFSAQTVAYHTIDFNRAYSQRGVSERQKSGDLSVDRARIDEIYIGTYAEEVEAVQLPKEVCAIRVELIEDLWASVSGVIPSGRQTYVGIVENIDAIFSASLDGCRYAIEEEDVPEDVGVVSPPVRYNNNCEQYPTRSRRRKICEVNEQRNEPFIGGQTRRVR